MAKPVSMQVEPPKPKRAKTITMQIERPPKSMTRVVGIGIIDKPGAKPRLVKIKVTDLPPKSKSVKIKVEHKTERIRSVVYVRSGCGDGQGWQANYG